LSHSRQAFKRLKKNGYILNHCDIISRIVPKLQPLTASPTIPSLHQHRQLALLKTLLFGFRKESNQPMQIVSEPDSITWQIETCPICNNHELPWPWRSAPARAPGRAAVLEADQQLVPSAPEAARATIQACAIEELRTRVLPPLARAFRATESSSFFDETVTAPSSPANHISVR
jgi:hypothetical protein